MDFGKDEVLKYYENRNSYLRIGSCEVVVYVHLNIKKYVHKASKELTFRLFFKLSAMWYVLHMDH